MPVIGGAQAPPQKRTLPRASPKTEMGGKQKSARAEAVATETFR
jgi:hypothetical protein